MSPRICAELKQLACFQQHSNILSFCWLGSQSYDQVKTGPVYGRERQKALNLENEQAVRRLSKQVSELEAAKAALATEHAVLLSERETGSGSTVAFAPAYGTLLQAAYASIQASPDDTFQVQPVHAEQRTGAS